jgi:hypothetical protein
MITAEQTPGFTSALAIVQRAGGVLLTDQAAFRLTTLALAAAGPHIRADMLADTADDITEAGRRWEANGVGEVAAAMYGLARSLDQASHDIREALTR